MQLSARSVPSALRRPTLGIRIRNLADISLQSPNPTLDEPLVLDGIVPVRRLEISPVASPTDYAVVKDALAGSGLTSAHSIVPCECSHAARPRQGSPG